MVKPLASTLTIADDFPPVGYDEWRALVEKALQGAPFDRKLITHTYEGIDVQPVYSRRDQLSGSDPQGLPGFPPFVRGAHPLGQTISGWDVRPEYLHPDLAVTNREVLEDLAGGATSVQLQLDAAACYGLDPDADSAASLAGRDGVMVYSLDDFDAVFEDVKLEMITVAIDAGAVFMPAAAALLGLWRRRGVSPKEARGAFNADPLALLARSGGCPVSASRALELLADLAQWTSETCSHVTAVGVDTSPYHDAGATAAQDIAFAMATAVEYLRAMTARGMGIDAAARQILFRLGLGTHHFLAIAKLRAARQLWSRVVEASGGSAESGAMQMHVRTSDRVLTHRDPHVNLLRNTVVVFAAGLGGADAITSVPYDATVGWPDSASRRVARNTVLVLQEEAHLNRVIDPAGGSWFLDQLTQQLALKGWEIFQDVERQGGMLAALRSGWISAQIEEAYAPRARDIARRKEGITGVSEFPDVHEAPVPAVTPDTQALRAAATTRIRARRPAKVALDAVSPESCEFTLLLEAAAEGATIGQMARALGFHAAPAEGFSPLKPRSFARPFEELRAASDAWLASRGSRPSVFLANMGPVSHHTARATYAKNFFEAGGFDVLTNNGFGDVASAVSAFEESGAGIAVICSSDKLYPEYVPQTASRLKQAGARCVVLAGQPGDNEQAWRAAGVDRFIFMKCDVLAILREMLAEEGVLNA